MTYRDVLRAVLLAVAPYAIIAVLFVGWLLIAPTGEVITQAPLTDVTRIDFIYRGKVVRTIAGHEEIERAVAFLDSKRSGWSPEPAGKSKALYQVAYVSNGTEVARLHGSPYFFELHRGRSVFNRIASVEDHVAALTALGLPQPPKDLLKDASETTLNQVIRAMSKALDARVLPPPA